MSLLLFHLDTNQESALVEGRLLLIDNDQIIEQYKATSGCPNNQSYSHISAKGRGPIPPQYETKINNYRVSTTPLYMPGVKGVEGNFFKIDPHIVRVGNVERGDFGIHADKNVPGSAGCIVLVTDTGWLGYQVQMKKLVDKGISQIPLLISYVR
jgi:hypothetical protein